MFCSINTIGHYVLYYDGVVYLLLFWYWFGRDGAKLDRQSSKIDRLRIERAHCDALLKKHGDALDEAFRKTLLATLQAASRRYKEGQYRGVKVWRWSRLTTVAHNYILVLDYSTGDLKERLLKYFPEGPPPPRYYEYYTIDD